MKKNIYFILIFIFIGACKYKENIVDSTNELRPLILVSKDPKGVFSSWLESSLNHNNFICYNMYPLKNNDSIREMLKLANGIIISGGEDVYPGLYGREIDTSRCGSFDRRRDSLEQTMIKFAVYNKVPLLGVCRGHQILNVTLGGTLIIDIPDDVGSEYLHRDKRKAKRNKSTKVFHNVHIENHSFLNKIVEADKGKIYSNHHQAIDALATLFKASSYADDEIIEAVELADTSVHPFILGVQWHPEAMKPGNPLSGKIAYAYFSKVNSHFLK